MVLGEGSFFGFLAGHAQMVGSRLAAFALLGFAGGSGADESVDCVVPRVFRLDLLSCGVLLGCVLGISLLELELQFALAALDEVAHFPDGLVLEGLEALVAHEPLELVLHHDGGAAGVEALEVAALVDKLGVDVLVDAGHAEDVPAVVDVEEDFSVEVFVVFAIALCALDDLGFVHVEVGVPAGLLHHLRLHLGRLCPVLGVELAKYFAEGSFLLVGVVDAGWC